MTHDEKNYIIRITAQYKKLQNQRKFWRNRYFNRLSRSSRLRDIGTKASNNRK